MNLSKLLSGFVMMLVVGCTPLNLQAIDFPNFGLGSDKDEKEAKKDKDAEDEDEEGEFDTKVTTPLVAEYVQISGLNMIALHGVGLVTGLNGTGGDPPPSMHRTALLEDMKRREIKHPNELLKSPNNALVIVKAYLPPLIRKGEAFDIEVYAPEGSPVKNLNGGWLLPVDLSEQALIPGRGLLEGHRYAKAEGPILVSMGTGDEGDKAGVLRRGRIVAGGKSLKDRNLTLYLRNDFRSYRNSKRVAESIGKRFYEYDESGQRKPLAVAKTDQQIELKVLSKYKDNFPRYLQVIRNIAFREETVARRVRMRKLKGELLDPQTAEDAALKLEAIGEEAVPILKSGLQSKSLEVRFHSAASLAYLSEPDGLGDLAKAVREEAAFRVFGLAALASLDVAESHVQLRQLLNETSAETRYGAFRALTTLDKNDPFVQGEKLNGQFSLHVLETEGPPLVHLTNRRKAEVVLFGAEQKFKTPFSARAGLHILVNAPAGSETVTISRFEVGKEDRRQTVSTRVADVVRAVTEMEASYPDVAMMLAQAGATQNLAGRIEIDALPQAGRSYIRPSSEVAGSTEKKARIGNSNLVPNLYSSFSENNTKEKTSQADDVINEKKDDKTAEKSDEPDSKGKKKKSEDRAASRDKKAGDEAPLEESDDLRADAGKPKTREAKKPAEKKIDSPKESETDEVEPASEARSWNPFRFFRGMGQSEPDVSETESTKSEKVAEAQSEP